MSTSIDALIPELQDGARQLLALASRAQVNPQVTSTLRSNFEQKRLYERYLRGESRYPAAPPGTSAHEYGWAFDLLVAGEQNQYDLGQVWQSWGGVWGGSKDPIHFEMPGFRQAFQSERPDIRTAPAASVQASPRKEASVLSEAVDLILGLNPIIGYTELVAWLLSLGFPQSQILDFLSGPAEYISAGKPAF